jgi:short-subunit dehydrogenase
MTGRGRGQVAIVSSLASFRGTPQSAAYCASKAAVRVWGEGLRGRLLRKGVLVSVVCPGFVATPMTAGNRFPMPMVMTADKAAAVIARGLAKARARIAFPIPMYLGVRLFAAMPQGVGDWLVGRYRGKE